VKDPVSFIARKAVHSWRNSLTSGGRFLLMAVVFAGGLASVSPSIPIDHMFSTLVCFYAVAVVVGWIMKPRVRVEGKLPEKWIMKPRVRVEGKLPEKVSAGQTVHGRFSVENASRLPVYDLGLRFESLPRQVEHRESEKVMPQLRAAESAHVDVELVAWKRGVYELSGLRPTSTFPFGICQSHGKRHDSGNLLVLPNFFPITNVGVPVGRRYQPGGIALTSNVGESPEYIGSRDYRPGDPYRRLDFRSWARLAAPAVKEFQEEYYCRLALVVDTFVASGRKKARAGFPELEAAVSLAAAVADALSRGEYLLDVFAAGPELYVFRAGRHIAHLDNILEILACVDECRKNPFETITPAIAGELANITSVICVLLDWDEERARFVRAAIEAGSAAKVVIVRDGPTTQPFASAEEWTGPITLLTPEEVASGQVEEI